MAQKLIQTISSSSQSWVIKSNTIILDSKGILTNGAISLDTPLFADSFPISFAFGIGSNGNPAVTNVDLGNASLFSLVLGNSAADTGGITSNTIFSSQCGFQNPPSAVPTVNSITISSLQNDTNENSIQSDIDDINSQYFAAVRQAYPMYQLSLTFGTALSREQSGKKDQLAYPDDVNKEDGYIAMLTAALSYTQGCSDSVNLDKGSINQATQVGSYIQALDDAVYEKWKQNLNPSQVSSQEAAKKAANSGLATSAPSAIAPPVSVNPSLTDLEQAQARAQADNQIVFISGSSGANNFTNMGLIPTNILTMLDILRDEQSSSLFDSTVVSMSDVPNVSPAIVNQCEKIFGKLTPKQILALIKTINDQIDYNTRILERSQMILNKLANAAGLSALWAGVKLPSFQLASSPSSILDAIEAAAHAGYANLTRSAGDALGTISSEGKKLLSAGETIYNAAASDVTNTIQFASNTFADDSALLIKNIKENSAAMAEILASLSDADKSLCSSLNELAKIANAPQTMKDASAKLTVKATADLQKIEKHALELKSVVEAQASLASISTMLSNILKSKTGG